PPPPGPVPGNTTLANAVTASPAAGKTSIDKGAPSKSVATADLAAVAARKPPVPPLVSGTAQAGAKIRALSLLQQARELARQGLLGEAREKAMEADHLKVAYGPEEDNPSYVLVSLAAQCERTVDQLLQRATDQVQNHPTDPGRFKKAEADIDKARLFARTFRL